MFKVICSQLVLLLMLFCFSALAISDVGTDQANSDFDHLTTGFFLSPAHRNVECSNCHVRGIYKGTPTKCDGCHNSSTVITALGKDSGHINSSGDCKECHSETAGNWSGINFKTHDAVIGDCSGCHNDRIAVGKPPQHIPSSERCEDCHSSTSTYTVGVFDHSNTTDNCYSCHDGNHSGTPVASATHMNSSTTCESCHNALTKSWTSIIGVDHGDVIQGTCDDCHSVSNGVGPTKSSKHIPSHDECDSCHNTSNFLGTTFDHSGTTTNCYSCHDGGHSGAPVESATHMNSSTTCESCHNALTKDWYSIVNVDHGDVIQGTCESCHAGRRPVSTKQPSNHIVSSDTCDNCHFNAGVSWLGATNQENVQKVVSVAAIQAKAVASSQKGESTGSSVFVHPDVSGNCQSCHNGLLASGQPINHIKTLPACDDCHAQKSWIPTLRVDHTSTFGSCFSCHNRKTTEGKPLNHISSGNNCDNCHVTYNWSQVVMDHSDVTGSCALCHDGRSAPAKPSNHIASNNTCNDCHRRRTWTPVYRVDHLAVFGSCSSCHNGRNAEGKPVGHPGTHNNCEECHRTNLWSQVVFNHDNVSGTCLSCHIGDYKQNYHKKTQQSPPIYYTANELVDCAGSCHVYEGQTFSSIATRRQGPEHRFFRGAW